MSECSQTAYLFDWCQNDHRMLACLTGVRLRMITGCLFGWLVSEWLLIACLFDWCHNVLGWLTDVRMTIWLLVWLADVRMAIGWLTGVRMTASCSRLTWLTSEWCCLTGWPVLEMTVYLLDLLVSGWWPVDRCQNDDCLIAWLTGVRLVTGS